MGRWKAFGRKNRNWYKKHKSDIQFAEREGLLLAGAGVVASGIASGEISPAFGEQIALGVTTGTALNVMKRSEQKSLRKKY